MYIYIYMYVYIYTHTHESVEQPFWSAFQQAVSRDCIRVSPDLVAKATANSSYSSSLYVCM